MSKFLAPIHSWLFAKIVIHQDLEKEIAAEFESEYGDKVKDIVTNNIDKYGEKLGDDKLEDIIDPNNIHGWLQDNIAVVETRQAGIIADLISEFGSAAQDKLKLIFKGNAKNHASQIKDTGDFDSAQEIQRTINNYILDGMPCDSANTVVKSDADILETVKNHCLHIGYWEKAGVDSKLMYSLREDWISSFVETLNPDFAYSVVGNIATIKRK